MEDKRINEKAFNIISFALLSDGRSLDLSTYISFVRISFIPLKHVMPKYEIRYNLTPDIIKDIQLDSSHIRISLEIKTVSSESVSGSEYVSYLDKIILKPLLMDKNLLQINDKLSKPTNSSYQPEPFEIVCLDEVSLSKNKINVGAVYQNVNMTEIISSIATKANLPTYIYPLDNEKLYKQVIIPPLNINQAIKYLNDVYGLYNSHLKSFFLDSALFIMPLTGMNSFQNGNININIEFPVNKEEEGNIKTGSYREFNTINKDISSVNIKDKTTNITLSNIDELNVELFGNNNSYISRSVKQGIFETDLDDSTDYIDKRRYYQDIYENEHTLNTYRNQVINNTHVQYMFNNMDISLNDLQKKINLSFNNNYYNSKYSGEYQLLGSVITFNVLQTGLSDQKGILYLKEIPKQQFFNDSELQFVK